MKYIDPHAGGKVELGWDFGGRKEVQGQFMVETDEGQESDLLKENKGIKNLKIRKLGLERGYSII